MCTAAGDRAADFGPLHAAAGAFSDIVSGGEEQQHSGFDSDSNTDIDIGSSNGNGNTYAGRGQGAYRIYRVELAIPEQV